jgi:hypothetical protein
MVKLKDVLAALVDPKNLPHGTHVLLLQHPLLIASRVPADDH